MSNRPIIYLFLLLLGFQAPQAQGRHFLTHQLKDYSEMIYEIMEILNKSPLSSQDPLDPNDTETLRQNTLLRPNLNEFLKAAENFPEYGLKIQHILKKFLPLLPMSTPTDEPLLITSSLLPGEWVSCRPPMPALLPLPWWRGEGPCDLSRHVSPTPCPQQARAEG
ncbi:interleukin-3-like [Suricata suricatta]|uniref:interleukin-3-like n=1 Tax=Suricata suricatta TaxID=37032 RepID=UPI001156051E|nr:interleukin-3-like [Suricata suricatta]